MGARGRHRLPSGVERPAGHLAERSHCTHAVPQKATNLLTPHFHTPPISNSSTPLHASTSTPPTSTDPTPLTPHPSHPALLPPYPPSCTHSHACAHFSPPQLHSPHTTTHLCASKTLGLEHIRYSPSITSLPRPCCSHPPILQMGKQRPREAQTDRGTSWGWLALHTGPS